MISYCMSELDVIGQALYMFRTFGCLFILPLVLNKCEAHSGRAWAEGVNATDQNRE